MAKCKYVNKKLKTKEMIGLKFGKLTVLSKSEHRGKNNKEIYYRCKCECGSVKDYLGTSLRRNKGAIKSCGCEPKNKTHGLHGTRLYKILDGMKYRCLNSNCPNYHNYGGRGISICEEWLNKEDGMSNFYKWAIANGYDDSLSIDRINNDGNYEPSNCRWVDKKIQANNKSTNVYLEYNGVVKTISEWSDYSGIQYGTLLKRLEKGMTIDEAINTELFKPKIIYINDIGKTFREWSECSGVNESTLRNRYENGVRGFRLLNNDTGGTINES